METDTNVIALVNDAIKGNQYAFKKLYMQFGNQMFNICMRMINDRQEAEDVVQDSFIKAFNNLEQLKDKKMFGAWLRKIVVNASIRKTKSTTDFKYLDAEYEVADKGDEEWYDDLGYAALHVAIKNLPDGCRQIFLLYVIEDLAHKEIASVLDISESTSKSQYARAKKLLKEHLIVK